ncbi:hypothetical protein EDB84DRAFT_1659401 [Lactarius hengduanensis]|nr:hypothetical protein EDB84DRAFT_1659401 [Lactarius hengduanensis]
MSTTCGWWRKFFTDHPYYIRNSKARPPEVWANTIQDKIRVYCTKCLEQDVGRAMQEDEDCERRDLSFIKRTPDEIKLALFNVPPQEPHSWLESRPETLQTHIRHCPYKALESPATASAASGSMQVVLPPNNPVLGIDLTPRTQRTYIPIVSPRPIPFNQVPPIAQWTGSPLPPINPVPSPALIQFPQYSRSSVFL